MSIVTPIVIVTVVVTPYPRASADTERARGVTAGASISLGIVADIVGVSVGIKPSALYVDSAMAVVAHSDRQAGKNLIIDLFGELSRAVLRPSTE